MFTGIITDLGEVRSIKRGGDTRFEFTTGYDTAAIAIGASICCSGVCMTVIDKEQGWFAVSASAETLSKSTMGSWKEGSAVNFERSLKAGDEMGGHIVSGHVDGVARLAAVSPDGDSLRMAFSAPEDLKRFIATKGSLAIDGVSMTVNDVHGGRFAINVIPHTRDATTLGRLKEGDAVNVEIDMLARYVARLLEFEKD